MIDKYENIINLPHHVSNKHERMSIEARAAQFAPFAALTGYGDEVKETERITVQKIELDEENKKILDNKIRKIISNKNKINMVSMVYFIKDEKKDGGEYVTVNASIKNIDKYRKLIILNNGKLIPIDDILSINDIKYV